MSDWYCAGELAPEITGLHDLLIGLGLETENPADMSFAITAHSSSIVIHNTTVLNPRMIVFTDSTVDDYALLGFVRGEGFAEVIAHDTAADDLNFYVFTYQVGCEPYCTNADRFLPSNETGWSSVSVYGHDDLQNTAFDCIRCHAPGGGNTKKILRMQEIRGPWTHWNSELFSSVVLEEQFLAAHGDEEYGGVPGALLDQSNPGALEVLLTEKGFGEQPNEYDGALVNQDDPGIDYPTPGWLELYERAVAGAAIPPPHFAVNPFDGDKVANFTQLYRSVRDGALGPEQMPDLTDLFRSEDARYLSFKPAAGLDGAGIVGHACGTCHDGRFPELSRNNFKVQDFPDELSPEMKALIRERLHEPDHSIYKMPPAMIMELSDEEIASIEQALQ